MNLDEESFRLYGWLISAIHSYYYVLVQYYIHLECDGIELFHEMFLWKPLWFAVVWVGPPADDSIKRRNTIKN